MQKLNRTISSIISVVLYSAPLITTWYFIGQEIALLVGVAMIVDSIDQLGDKTK